MAERERPHLGEKITMKTSTFRVNEAHIDLLDTIAERENTNQSEEIRKAIAAHIQQYAESHPDFVDDMRAAAQNLLEKRLREVQRMFGEGVLDHLDFPKPPDSSGEK